MQKEIYIIRGLPSEDYKSFKNRIFDLSEAVIKKDNPEKLKICLTLNRPPRISIIPFKRKKIASFSVHRERGPLIKTFTEAAGFAGGYAVEEAIPVSYSRNWDDGVITPGICLLTLFHRKPAIDEDTFIRRWHEGHTPLSLKLHPLWNYYRNVVSRTLTENSSWYDGIVEEQVQKEVELLNPFIFFGPPLKVPVHMFQVFMDTRSFIDMRRIETYLASEFHLKSL
jgi:hypothetical protein